MREYRTSKKEVAASVSLVLLMLMFASSTAWSQGIPAGPVAKAFKTDDAVLYIGGNLKYPTEADTTVFDVTFKIKRSREWARAGRVRPRISIGIDGNVSTLEGASADYIRGDVPLGLRFSSGGDLQVVLSAAPTIERDKDHKFENRYGAIKLELTDFPNRLRTTEPLMVDTASHEITSKGRIGWLITPRVGLAFGNNQRAPIDQLPERREDDIERRTAGLAVVLDVSPAVQRIMYGAGRLIGKDWFGAGLVLRADGSIANVKTAAGRQTFNNFIGSAQLLVTPTVGIEATWERGRVSPTFRSIRNFRVGLAYFGV
jgi:hypothetical protein